MDKKKRSAYSTPLRAQERGHLEALPHPAVVSRRILDKMEFTTLLDAGCGTDPRLAQYVVQQRKALYSGFDSGKGMKDGAPMLNVAILGEALAQLKISAVLAVSDIRVIRLADKIAEVVHERFVFAHLAPSDRLTALDELMRVASQTVILLEYDWGTMRSTNHDTMLNRFVQTAFEVREFIEWDPFAGQSVPQMVATHVGACTRAEAHGRPEDDYTDELLELCAMLTGLSTRFGKPELAQKFQDLGAELQAAPIEFVPADIVATIVSL